MGLLEVKHSEGRDEWGDRDTGVPGGPVKTVLRGALVSWTYPVTL